MLALALLLLLPPPLLLAVGAEQCDGPEMGGLCGLVLARCDAAEPDRALWSTLYLLWKTAWSASATGAVMGRVL
jgi:hypothetical protein